jgi:hypothetical protein
MTEQNQTEAREPLAHSNDQEPGPDGLLKTIWRHGAVACLWTRHGTYNIEVRLVLDDVVIQREFFADADSASKFALGKQRAYVGS